MDYGRFAASLAVVVFHYTYNGILNGKVTSIDHLPYITSITRYGHYGVDLFFIISGYVIFYSAENKRASRFAYSRIKRLYPTFWFGMLFSAFFAFLWGQGTVMAVTGKQVLANLSMMPNTFGERYVDGVYWTLLWELRFYALVFLLLLSGLGRHLRTLFMLWPYYLVIAHALRWDGPYTDSNYALFVAGSLFAMLKGRMDPWYLFSLALCFITGAFHDASFGLHGPGAARTAALALFFGFFFVLNTSRGGELKLPGSLVLGALTYPIYLVHAHFGYLFLSRFATNDNRIAMYLLLFGIVLAVTYAMHVVVEERMAPMWSSLFKRIIERPIARLEGWIDGLRSRTITVEQDEAG